MSGLRRWPLTGSRVKGQGSRGPAWPPTWLPWRRAPDLATDHGHRPYSAWEAELAAYARLRTGGPVKVLFTVGPNGQWSEELHLVRPDPRLSPGAAFAAAELELEHLLMHHRHGWREVDLLWSTWARAGEPVVLPWPPWDHIPLPAAIVREALIEAVPALALPAPVAAWRQRSRDAAQWIAAAWADGTHRALELAERPGLAGRLPLPPLSGRPHTWDVVLCHLATGGAGGMAGETAPAAGLPPEVGAAFDGLMAVPAIAIQAHVPAVLDLVQVLDKHNALPPSHRQRPPWLRPMWGRWRRPAELRQALERLARSPATVAVAAATAAARVGGGRLPRGGRVLGSFTPQAQSTGLTTAAQRGSPDQQARRRLEDDQDADSRSEWGTLEPGTLPDRSRGRVGEARTGAGEGQGVSGRGLAGAGPGALGALHVVDPAAEDRAAYWQLRGALAPEIERLIERLRAAGEEYHANAPRRFQRAGRLDRNRLAAAMSGRESVFIRFVHHPAPAHALCLLLDCSASMTTRAEDLRKVAILVESASAAVGARVTAFAFGAAWERMEPPAEGAPLVALGRELHPHGGTPFGPAVAAAAEWLAHQPYRLKRLWVFSDGQWSARDRADTNWRPEFLKDVVVWVLSDAAPEPPTPAMRIVAAPTLADLVQLAPTYFWATPRAAVVPAS